MCLSLVAPAIYAQNNLQESQNNHYQLMDELEGTYQIQMINSRAKPAIDTDLLESIKANQKDAKEVTFMYKPNIQIVVKSKQDVQQGKTFTKEEKIIYINQ